ncbi:sugar O-acetyltransferase [Candidatus Nitrospira bockiana]
MHGIETRHDPCGRPANDDPGVVSDCTGERDDNELLARYQGTACDYGYNIRLGRNAFINYNCVFLDCGLIEIGDNLQMGPAVQLYTAAHPLEADLRRSGMAYARPIRIGHDVWIGGGVVILPGVTIGDQSVVGAGSVVTRDIPSACVVAGNPAHIVRILNDDSAHHL